MCIAIGSLFLLGLFLYVLELVDDLILRVVDEEGVRIPQFDLVGIDHYERRPDHEVDDHQFWRYHQN